jgi:hypothetical protein
MGWDGMGSGGKGETRIKSKKTIVKDGERRRIFQVSWRPVDALNLPQS